MAKIKPFHTEDGTELTDELLDKLAAPWDRGEIPEGEWGPVFLGPGSPGGPTKREWRRMHATPPGRPPLSEDEPSAVVTFKMPRSLVDYVKRAADACGQTKSKFIREAVLEKARKVLGSE